MNKPSLLVNLVRSLPRMEELTIWSSLRHVEDLTHQDLQNLVSLKLAGLEHSRYFLEKQLFILLMHSFPVSWRTACCAPEQV